MRILHALLLASFAFLTACGGGGGGGTPAPATLPYTYTSSNGDRIKTTVTHATGNESSISAIAFIDDISSFGYGSPTDLSNYLLDNGTNTYTVASSGITATNFATLTATNQQVTLGGSSWAYSRYGLFIDKTPNSNGANTQYLMRHMPYIRYLRYNTATFTGATYAQVGSKAAGGFVTDQTRWATVNCNVSIVATSTGGEGTSIDLTLSGCDNGIVTSGYLRLTKPTISGTASATLGTFGATSNGDTFTPTSASGFYGVAGPNSEELVGHVVVRGTTLVSGVAKTTRFTLAFGGRK